ncbi:hypothetical protein [Nonomuraea sp. GTA35]|uniref:hypothetical protein n=1 Tax=Nonomuraea sp. GTA35 TaxID=1676746 RepID=UPI0035C0FF77
MRVEDELARWDSYTPAARHRILTAFWLELAPSTARARFAAAVDVLALLDDELAVMQQAVDHFPGGGQR